jgi:hypothetical protein
VLYKNGILRYLWLLILIIHETGKIQFLLDFLVAHAATEKGGYFYFFEKFSIFQKNKNIPLLSHRSVAH